MAYLGTLLATYIATVNRAQPETGVLAYVFNTYKRTFLYVLDSCTFVSKIKTNGIRRSLFVDFLLWHQCQVSSPPRLVSVVLISRTG